MNNEKNKGVWRGILGHSFNSRYSLELDFSTFGQSDQSLRFPKQLVRLRVLYIVSKQHVSADSDPESVAPESRLPATRSQPLDPSL